MNALGDAVVSSCRAAVDLICPVSRNSSRTCTWSGCEWTDGHSNQLHKILGLPGSMHKRAVKSEQTRLDPFIFDFLPSVLEGNTGVLAAAMA